MLDRGIGRKERKGHKVGKRKMHPEGLLSRASFLAAMASIRLDWDCVLECDVVAALGQIVGAVAADQAGVGDEDFCCSLVGGFNSLEAHVQSQ
jgi:hypothetical protein